MRPAAAHTALTAGMPPLPPRATWRRKLSLRPHCGFQGLHRTASSDQVERPLPARLVEEMQHYLTQKQQSIAPRGLAILIVRRFERPVDKHRPPNDVFLRNKSPVSAIETHSAMVAHRKVVIG